MNRRLARLIHDHFCEHYPTEHPSHASVAVVPTAAMARFLGQRTALIVLARGKLRAVRKRHGDGERDEAARALLRAGARELPLAEASLDVLLIADMLGRDGPAAQLFQCWSALLRPGGILLVAEATASPGLGSLMRRARGVMPLAAEDLTGLLLNAGFGAIRQLMDGGLCVTSGQWRAIPPAS